MNDFNKNSRAASNPWAKIVVDAEGKTAKEISAELNISIYTVDAHRNRIFRKLQLRSSAELVRFAMRQGLLPK